MTEPLDVAPIQARHAGCPSPPCDVPALIGEVLRLRALLAEMTHCRDNALRALHRDDVETDIDVEDIITSALCGPGWDWEDERTPGLIARDVAPAIRPALAKATEQRDQARAEAVKLHAGLEIANQENRRLFTENVSLRRSFP